MSVQSIKTSLKRNGNLYKRLLWVNRIVEPVMRLVNVGVLPRYVCFFRDFYRYRRIDGSARLREWYPCLFDNTTTTGFDAHYFYQAVWLAGKIKASGRQAHVDVGSDVKLVGILTNFTHITFIDIRPLNIKLKNFTEQAGSVLALPFETESVKSLSCLHVIEHVGLGRYGDPLDADGSKKACRELERVLEPGGDLYLSLPIGRERTCFNAHRVFLPETILNYFAEMNLKGFSMVDDGGCYVDAANAENVGELEYGCGLFHFQKKKAP